MTILSEQSTEVPDSKDRCESCGSITESWQSFCGVCGTLLIKPLDKDNPPEKGMGCLGVVLTILAVLVIALYLVCQNIHFG